MVINCSFWYIMTLYIQWIIKIIHQGEKKIKTSRATTEPKNKMNVKWCRRFYTEKVYSHNLFTFCRCLVDEGSLLFCFLIFTFPYEKYWITLRCWKSKIKSTSLIHRGNKSFWLNFDLRNKEILKPIILSIDLENIFNPCRKKWKKRKFTYSNAILFTLLTFFYIVCGNGF